MTNRSVGSELISSAKSCTSLSELRSIIEQAIESPNTLTFGELLDLPNVQETHNVLKLFTYGTLKDYFANQSLYPPLSKSAIKKLRLVTLVSLAASSRQVSYSVLLEHLMLDNVRELEDLIIEGIYLDIIKGKLDQKEKQLEVDFVIGRDVDDARIDQMIDILSKWYHACTSVLESSKNLISYANNERSNNTSEKKKHDAEVASVKKALTLQPKGSFKSSHLPIFE